jgi:hypothetical protein
MGFVTGLCQWILEEARNERSESIKVTIRSNLKRDSQGPGMRERRYQFERKCFFLYLVGSERRMNAFLEKACFKEDEWGVNYQLSMSVIYPTD